VKKISVIMVVVFLIAGCAPSRSAWLSSKDGWVGTTFESHVYSICSRTPHTCTEPFWSPANKEKTFDRLVKESSGTRYYITWIRNCRYSVLVSPESRIVSWKYETNNLESCYLF